MAVSIRNSLITVTCLIVIMASMPFAANSEDMVQPAKLYEQKIKAGLVYNFLKFTKWPKNALNKSGNRLNVCLYGGDAFDGYLNPLKGRTAQQYIINILPYENPNQLDNCHIVFIHQTQEGNLSSILEYLKGKSILVMSDIENFSKRGGMIEFTMTSDQHIHIYANKERITTARLSIEERLLKLTEPVE